MTNVAFGAMPQPVAVPELAQWTLTAGGKGVKQENSLEIIGEGRPNFGSWWVSPAVSLESGKTYRFTVDTNASKNGGGSAPCGPEFANRDYMVEKSEGGTTLSHVFRVPDNVSLTPFRLGQWASERTFTYRNPKIEPTMPLYQGGDIHPLLSSRTDILWLGDGESIRDGVYKFQADYDHYGSNDHRPLWKATAGFNSDRWTFGNGSEVVYKFELQPIEIIRLEASAPIQFLSGKCSAIINYHVSGKCLLLASRDGNEWTELGTIDKVGQIDAIVPESFFPAETLYLKLKAENKASFQVNRLTFESPTDCGNITMSGKTLYPEITFEDNASKMAVEPLFFNNLNTWFKFSDNAAPVPFDVISGTIGEDHIQAIYPGIRIKVKYDIPEYHRPAELGFLLERGGLLWTWGYPEQKLSQNLRILPKESPLQLFAAKNEYESVQISLQAQRPVRGVTASISDLKTAGGATIAASNVEIRYAYYHFVEHPTDKTGVSDFWPDALIPFDEPVNIESNKLLPVWFTVYVPEDAAAGDYTATVTMKADDIHVSFPLNLHVWDFTLPKSNTLETAFGLGWHRVFQYHNCTSEADKRAVIELYLENFAGHRVSPYNPTPLDPIRVQWNTQADPPRAEIDFAAFDKEMERVLEKFRFTNFVIPIHGMGGGTYESRNEPNIAGFTKETPQFKALFTSYATQLERHLIDKGWIDKAYVYWFDEPDPKDYEFVAESYGRLSAAAPGIRKMITEEPGDGFLDALQKANTNIDIWCPVSYNYDPDGCDKRLAAGETLWWYVCCGPKEPYCTLFIDHGGTEMRIWHWQAFQRGITGSLVWESCWWTSDTAFPDSFQNPYEDPMGYVSSGALPKGTKQYWGNGDGRFIYPPLDAATPGRNNGKPVLKAPNSSIRWEVIRDGIEDYEMLVLAGRKQKDREKLQTLSREITSSLTDFTRDPKVIRKTRDAVAKMIE